MSATGRTAQADTRDAVTALHARMSYPAIARKLDLPRRFWPVLSRIVNSGPVSVAMENDVRRALGMNQIPAQKPADVCLDCGAVHVATARCNGQPVTVRLVRPDGTSNRKRYWRPCLPVNLSADQKRRIMKITEE